MSTDRFRFGAVQAVRFELYFEAENRPNIDLKIDLK